MEQLSPLRRFTFGAALGLSTLSGLFGAGVMFKFNVLDYLTANPEVGQNAETNQSDQERDRALGTAGMLLVAASGGALIVVDKYLPKAEQRVIGHSEL